jgi:hypothetical protein
MAKKIEIELDVKGNIVESAKNLRALKQELKGLDVGTAEYKKLFNQIDDLEDKLKSAKNSSSDWIDSLESAPGPLGMLGKGINNVKVATQSFGGALKALGIGLLVSLIGGLVAAFTQTEGSMKKLQPLLIGMEKIFGGLVQMAQPFLDVILDLGLKALPIVTTAFKNVYSAVFSVLQSLGKLGSAVMKLIKGDFSGAWEDAKASVNDFGKNFEQNQKNFEAGAAKMTKTEKENLKAQSDARKEALDKRLKQMETQDKLDEAKMNKMKQEALALAKTEQEKLDIEKKFADEAYKAKSKDIQDKMALYNKDSDEYKDLLTKKTDLDAEYVKQTKEFKDKQIDVTKNANKELMDEEVGALNLRKAKGELTEEEYQAELYKIQKKYLTDKKELNAAEVANEQSKTNQRKAIEADERNRALTKLQNEMNDLDKKNQMYDYDFQQDLARLEEKRIKLDEAEKLELAAAEKNEIEKNKIKQKYSDERKKIDETEVQVKKSAEETKYKIALTYLQAAGQFGSILGSLSKENKKQAIAGLLIEKAAALGSIAVNAKKNFVADGGIKSPLAWANLTVAGLNALAVVISAKKGVDDINNAGSSGGGGEAPDNPNSAASLGRNYAEGGYINGPRHAQGGVMINAEGGEAIMTRGAVTMFGPLLSALNQAGGGTSFSSGVLGGARLDNPTTENPAASQQPMVLKTYVVSNELTTEQEKLARLKDLSTL